MPIVLALILSLFMVNKTDLLDKYLGKNRILLVFTPDYQDDRFQRQQVILQNSKAKLKERDLILIEMNQNDGYGENQYSETEVINLRKKYSIKPSEFAVILIGKDGTEKLRYNDVVQAEQLISIIDSMPMRKEEMKSRK